MQRGSFVEGLCKNHKKLSDLLLKKVEKAEVDQELEVLSAGTTEVT